MTTIGLQYLSRVQKEIERSIPAIDMHLHTSWTDGEHSVQEMYEQACQLNLKYILFSEHARKNSIDWFHRFASEVRSLPKEPCVPLVGVEAKVIDFEGNIDLDDDILSLCDLVVGSVHRFPGENGDVRSFKDVSPEATLEIEYKLTCSLLENPKIHILGHPFGMSMVNFMKYPPREKFLNLIDKAAKYDVAFEINSKYHPEMRWLLECCKKAGAKISLGSDAHSKNEIGQIFLKLREI